MTLSILIVNYNTKDLLHRALASIISNPPVCGFEIIVVDNGSTDGSSAYLSTCGLPHVRPLLSQENLGFAKANNLAYAKSTGELVLFLNPDTEVLPGTLDACVDTLQQDASIGALGCRVMLADGSLDLACRRSFPTLSNSFFRFTRISKLFPKWKLACGYNLTYLPEDGDYEVECLVGAFMMIPRKVLEQCGAFDEDFFMYGEDIDLCFRIHQAGYRIFYLGSRSILHHKRASSKKSEKANHAFYESMWLYYKKHHQAHHHRLVNRAVHAAISLLERLH